MRLRENDQLLVPHMLWGLDAARVSCPMEMDFRRQDVRHRLFGAGTHVCAGAPLVRVEIPIFWREWLKRIPDFRLAPGKPYRTHVGMMMGPEMLHLEWDR